MLTRISHFTIYVRDLDDAKKWYTEKLGLMVGSDDNVGNDYRWLTMRLPYDDSPELVLAKADDFYFGNKPQSTVVIFNTNNCRRFCERLKQAGVKLIDPEPQPMPWGLCLMISDPDDNLIQIIQPKPLAA